MEGVKVSKPSKQGDLRIRGLEDTVSDAELTAAVADAGECDPQEIKVGTLRITPNGRGIVWVKCPLTSALRIAKEGKILVGWTRATVELLDARPAQCFRCFERGHARAECNSPIDRSSCCLRCGRPGHIARNCMDPPHCPLCHELGRASDHRVGGPACHPSKRGGRGGPTPASRIPLRRDEREPGFIPRGNPEGDMEAETLVEPPKEQRTPGSRQRSATGQAETSREETQPLDTSNGP